MKLGAFCLSLAVKDLAAARECHEKPGFRPTGGDPARNRLVLRNGQGMTCEAPLRFVR